MTSKKNYFYDSVVVGSGAGGSVAFHELASAHKGSVLMIEEGDQAEELPTSAPVITGFQRFYRNGGIRPILSNSGVIPFGEGSVLGGGTHVNGGLFWRTPQQVLRKWNSEGSFTDSRELEKNFAFYEKLLSVGPERELARKDQDSFVFKEAAKRLGHTPTAALRATRKCARFNRCPIGCPSGAKQTMARTLIPEAVRSGGEVWTGFRVLRFAKKARSGLLSLLVRSKTGSIRKVLTSSIYIAGGALESPALIHRSSRKIVSTFPLAIHLNAKVVARFPEALDATRSTIFTRQVQDFDNTRSLLMPSSHSLEFLALSSSNFPAGMMKEALSNPKEFASFTAQVAPRNLGRQIFFWRFGSRFYRLDRCTGENLTASVLKLVQVLFAAGACQVWLPVKRSRPVSSLSEASRELIRVRRRGWNVSSVHAMSSMPLPRSQGVRTPRVYADGRLRGYENVWIVDASLVPSHTIESPQATIMALARWVVRKSLLGRGPRFDQS